MSKDILKTTGAIIDGVYYRVEPYPFDPYAPIPGDAPYILKKAIAYRYVTDLTKGLFPYRGMVGDDWKYETAKVGIWLKKLGRDKCMMIIIRPRNAKEAAWYSLSQEKDFVAAVMNREYLPDQFMEPITCETDAGTDVFLPPMHTDDDSLNMLMKTSIRRKNAPFEPYGKRLQALAVDKKAGVERSNAKNNARRGLRINRAMSAGKFMEFADAWQLEAAFIVRDLPEAMHKMDIPEGKMLVIYPSGIPFDINQEDLIDIRDMVAQAIASPNSEEGEEENNDSTNGTEDGL